MFARMSLTTRTKILQLFTTKTQRSALARGSRNGFRLDPFRESESLSCCSFSSSAASAAVEAETASPSAEVLNGSRLFGLLKEYEDYRRNLYGGLTHKALFVDAVGTLLVPSQPMAQIYRQIGEKYGVEYSESEILSRYRWAYEQPWGKSRLRYVNDGRPFWQYIVSSSTGCSDSQYFEELYNYYTTEKAWHLCDPDAEKAFQALRTAGVKVAVVSNFDTRLRPLLRALKCDHWFDAVAVSAEVEAEKPNPTIFLKACELLGIQPEDAVHVGDDRRNDIWGARDAGCDAWLWGADVTSFREVAQRIGVQV
ncbi:N-acylneuraminate-9-phosphatase-like [Olea europaea var. sylvestris]|uniref:Haloacid dehalogenase-like hydrolase domain-containing 3 n=1 Tax=Olea europaea subsp. europaea TaxID=158383 RepID=A0A8S0T8J9_OLEEU|nr:N-acylneuraminate-9-phosphatase-like [Olea europaea var. sylvestris]CAA3001356.1 haloacid dehalogenase-like hydrolase domain-containing 3 [Olea europaea subsp. europaea]CAA3001357.1 haloacid dehalogenase-like hydrolase domain-containing 3 [Olea europaea subsp. europaea]